MISLCQYQDRASLKTGVLAKCSMVLSFSGHWKPYESRGQGCQQPLKRKKQDYLGDFIFKYIVFLGGNQWLSVPSIERY